MKNYSYKFRILPTENQKEILSRYFGCGRFIYNYYLNKSIQDYQQNKAKNWNKYEYVKDIVNLKKENERLKEVNSQSLQAVVENLDKAYNKFFTKGGGFPSFKKKGSKQSTKIPQFFKVEGNRIHIPKMKEGIKFIKDREIEGKIKSLTLSQDTDGKYYVSILVEREITELSKTGKSVGCDLGVKDLLITSDGDVYKTLKRKNESKIGRLQMRQSKKQKGSRRYKQLKTKIAKLHKADANRRNDYNHKISIQLVRNYDLIGLENLNVKGMMKNHKIANSVGSQGWYDLVTKLTYKSDRYGKQAHQISRWYPTSKQCYQCGNVKQSLKLSERTYVCECGYKEDRDINASKNILRYTEIELKL